MILVGDYGELVFFEFDFLFYVIMMLVNCEHVLFTYCQSSGILLLPVYKLRSREIVLLPLVAFRNCIDRQLPVLFWIVLFNDMRNNTIIINNLLFGAC